SHKEYGCHPFAILNCEQIMPVQAVFVRNDAYEKTHSFAAFRIEFVLIRMGKQLIAAVHQQQPKEQKYWFKSLDDRNACKDKDSPHHKRAEDTPKQYPVLVFLW